MKRALVVATAVSMLATASACASKNKDVATEPPRPSTATAAVATPTHGSATGRLVPAHPRDHVCGLSMAQLHAAARNLVAARTGEYEQDYVLVYGRGDAASVKPLMGLHGRYDVRTESVSVGITLDPKEAAKAPGADLGSGATAVDILRIGNDIYLHSDALTEKLGHIWLKARPDQVRAQVGANVLAPLETSLPGVAAVTQAVGPLRPARNLAGLGAAACQFRFPERTALLLFHGSALRKALGAHPAATLSRFRGTTVGEAVVRLDGRLERFQIDLTGLLERLTGRTVPSTAHFVAVVRYGNIGGAELVQKPAPSTVGLFPDVRP
jgi:hypothetical protein